MRRKVQIFISSLLLFFIISTAYSQNIISRLTLDSTINIATVNFEAPLVIQLKIPKEQTSVTLKVSFPEGINYSRIEVPQQEKTLVKVEKTTDSTINNPVFVVTAKPESVVNFLVYRKFSKCVKANVNYNDVVEAMIGGKTIEKSTSVPYQFRFPKLSIVTEPIEVGEKGENRRGFSVKNLGEGAIKEFYLSVQYPDNIKNKALSYRKNNGKEYLLVPENTVPKELANKGRYFYKVNADVLKKENNIQVSFSEIYEITNCFSVIPIQYQVYWGSDLTTEGLFEASKITEKIVSNYTVSNLLSYQEGKIRGETTDEVLYKGKIRINTIDKTIQTGEKSYFKVQLPVGITPVFSLGDLKSVVQLPQNLTEYTFLLPQGKKKNDSFDYTLKLQTNKKLTFVPSSKMVYYTTEESDRETCTATPLYTSIKKEITIPIEETLLHPIKLQTTDDTFSHTTTTQTIVLGNILTNDSYNSQSVTTASVTISTTTALTNVPYIATQTGEVFLPAHTPAGTYTLTYRLCAKSAPYNCSGVATVTVIVNPSSIKLQTTDDTFSHTTTTQTIVLGNVLTNDSYNSQSVTTASVTISTTIALTNVPYIAIATGEVLLPAHTPAGTYTLTYSLCPKSAPYNCSEVATVTIIVSPSPINLQTTNDTFSHTTTTQTIVLGNILTNDSYNTQSVTTTSVTISTTTILTNVPYIATSTGEVLLPAHTSAGTYTLTYSLCAKTAPYNCSEVATVTIIVSPSPIKLQTTDDTFSHTTTTQTIVLGNILTNDSYNTQSVTTASVTISTTIALTNVPYIAIATGEVLLPAHTPAGTYTLTYSLCPKSAPYNCSEVATVTIIVSPSPINLQTTNDTFSHTTTTQTIVLGNILTNDSYNTQSVTTTSVTISTTTILTNVPYIATSTGEVLLPAHTSAGTYTLTYSLCAKTAPYNCSEVATVTIIVSPSPIKLQTTDDTFSHTTTTQTIVLGNVLTNDSYNTQSVTTASVTISTTTALTNVPYIATATGEVLLPANVPAGTYTLTYSLCAKTAPYNCSEVATVTVSIIKPLVIARDDTYTVTIRTTSITESIYSNDSIGEQTPNAYSVNFQAIGGSKDNDNFYVLSVNLAGNILIPKGTPTGTYTLQYRICDVKDTHNCATATITVIVTEIPIAPIVARDDTYTVTIGITSITESIYTNDSIGEQTPNASLVNFQVIGGSKDSDNFYLLSVNLAGNVLIPQGTPIGTYTLEYRICDIYHQSNCDTAIVKVSITSPPVPPSSLVVTPDEFTYTGNSIVGNILANDTIDDNPIEFPNDDINIEAEEPTDTAPYIETSTGNVIVPTHTPAGTYTLNYELCIENLTICDVTTVEVIVPDTPTPPVSPQPQDDQTVSPTSVLTPYNAISLNGDNKNDYFHIEGIEKYPDNIVRIYNKEGLKVFDVVGYDNKNQSFRGFTQGKIAVKESLELSSGTYFYFIEYTDENYQLQRKAGWLYLRK
nr:gliding motility-associated C-terminal domain-containing protein [uncultured Capnocytophaga sp.]